VQALALRSRIVLRCAEGGTSARSLRTSGLGSRLIRTSFRVFTGSVRPSAEPAARVMLELALSRAVDPAAAVLGVVPGMGHVMTSPGLPEEVADLIRL
jgi:hypothetical protein